MRRTRWAAMLLASALAVSACGGSAEADGEVGTDNASTDNAEAEPEVVEEADAAEPATVSYWHAYSEESPEVASLRDVVIPAFQEANPNITVEEVAFPYSDLRQKLITSTAGGTLPCLVRSDIIWVPELAELGVLVPLDVEMSDFQELADQTFPGALATNKWNDNYWGLPLDTNTRVLMYNSAALQEAGMSSPPATFEELQALGDAVAGSGTFAFADNGTSGWNLLPWIWSGGGSLTDKAITTATGHLNSAESVAAIQMLVDMHDAGAIPDIIIGSEGGIPTSDGLPKGTYASILDGPWMFPIFEGQYPDFELQTAKIPAGPGGSISVVGGEDVVLTEGCEDPEAAMEFIRHLLSEEVQTQMAEVGQMSVLKDLDVTGVKDYYGIFVEQLQTARPRTPHPQYPKIEEILSNEVQRAFRGEVSVQEALDSAASQIDAILAG